MNIYNIEANGEFAIHIIMCNTPTWKLRISSYLFSCMSYLCHEKMVESLFVQSYEIYNNSINMPLLFLICIIILTTRRLMNKISFSFKRFVRVGSIHKIYKVSRELPSAKLSSYPTGFAHAP